MTIPQLREHGVLRSHAHSLARSGRWQRVHPGVFATYSGPLRCRSLAWAAVLYAGRGARLSHEAAAHLCGLRKEPPALLTVTIPADRRVAAQPGLRVVRRRRPAPHNGVPPAVAAPHAALDLVESASDSDAVVGILCAAARARVTTSSLRRAARRRRPRRNAALVADVLAEVDDGVESPLERRFHRDVESAHRLPCAERQTVERMRDGTIRADCRYRAHGVRVELDGWLGHPGGRTDGDTWRDNAVLIGNRELTLRYRWRHVAGSPCRTAAQLSEALTLGGWTGRPRTCGPRCGLRGGA